MSSFSQESLRTGCSLLSGEESGVFSIGGKDAQSYFHRQLSNEIRNLAIDTCVDTCFLDPKAQIRLFFHLWRTEEGAYRAVLFGEQRHRFIDSFEHFVFTEEIVFQDESIDRGTHLLVGPGARDTLQWVLDGSFAELPPRTARTAEWEGEKVWVASYPWLEIPVYQFVCPRKCTSSLVEALVEAGAFPGDWKEFHTLRIEKGTPWPGFEVNDELIPFECGLSNSVSLSKGCYSGQEIIARMHNLGAPPRELRGLILEGDAVPEPGESVKSGEVEIGRILSSAFSDRFKRPIATSAIRRNFLEPGNPVLVGQSTGIVCDLPLKEPTEN